MIILIDNDFHYFMRRRLNCNCKSLDAQNLKTNKRRAKMKRVVILICALIITTAFAQSNKFRVDELILLPHPMKEIMKNGDKYGITKNQKDSLLKEIKSKYPHMMQPKMQEAFKLERKIIKEVTKKHRSPNKLKSEIDRVAELKREVTDIHIEALNEFAKILTKEQFDAVVKAFYNGGK